MSSTPDVDCAARELETNGFFVFHDFFPKAEAEQARQQILRWIEADLRDRQASGYQEAWRRGPDGTTILTRPTHLMLDAYAKSPVLDQMVERILTDPYPAGVLKRLVGEHIKFRGYNVQKLTGEADPRPQIGVAPNPHEWHRDSLGEIGIALFLEDVPGPDYGATSLVRGSHRFPYCPRWNCLFGPPYLMKGGKPGASVFLRFNLFSRLLAWFMVKPRATGAYGKQGDFYFFINDVWHGREPNLAGRTGIKVMIGAFATDDPFPDEVKVPDAAILDKLPPRLRAAASQAQPATPVPTENTIIKRLRVERSKHWVSPLFALARWERQLADMVCRRIRTT
jgi:hypothetical protein